MRISGWQIDGFGNFHDVCVDDVPGGLVVVCGPNEAGKTTLAHFLKGMLFGFPDGRRSKPRHPPLRGGSLGGSLTITGSHGELVGVARGEARSSLRLTDASGAVLPDATLDELLGHASEELFENVFAVELRDLLELRALSDEQVRDRIYSAGVLGAGRSARVAIEAIEKERDALYKPGGRGGSYRLNQLRDALRTVNDQLAEGRSAARELHQNHKEIAAVEARIHELDGQLEQQRRDEELLRSVLALWEPWQRAEAARAADAHSSPLPDLPPGFTDLLDAGVTDVANAEQEVADARAHEARRREERRAIIVDAPAAAAGPAISALSLAIGKEQQRREQLVELRQDLANHEQVLQEALARLGPGLDEAWLADQPATVEHGADLRDEARTLAEATEKAARARERSAAADEEARRMAPAPPVAAGAPTEPPSLELARQRVDDLRRLTALLAVPQPKASEPASVPPRSWLLAAAGLTLVALVLGVVGLAASSTALLVIALVVVAAAAAACGAAVLLRPHPTPATAGTGAPDGLGAELPTILARLGLAAPPTTGELGVLQRRAEEHERSTKDLEDARRHATEAAKELQDLEQAEHLARTAWLAWLEAHAMPAGIDPQGAEEYLRALQGARVARATRDRVASLVGAAQTASATFVHEVHELARGLGQATDDDPLVLSHRLVDVVREAVEAAHEATNRDARLADATEAVRKAAERLADAELKRDALVADAGASSVDEARAVAAQIADRREHESTIGDFEHALASRCGARAADVRRLLEEEDPTGWQVRAAECRTAVANATSERDACQGELRHLRDRSEEVLRSVRVPELEQQRSSLLADLDQAVRRWKVLCLASGLLGATLERYRQERQPAVVGRAAGYFAHITAGRYPQLVVDEGAVAVVDSHGNRVAETALSRGAKDQLYLSLRLALAGAVGTTSPLPLLLDDVLANSDGIRSPEVARVVAEVARERQVFFFTCHEAGVAMLQAADPAAHVIRLSSSA